MKNTENNLDYNPSARDMAMGQLSDIFKDVHGFRPRGYYNWEVMTDQDIEDEMNSLCEKLSERMAFEAEEIKREEREEQEQKANFAMLLSTSPILENRLF